MFIHGLEVVVIFWLALIFLDNLRPARRRSKVAIPLRIVDYTVVNGDEDEASKGTVESDGVTYQVWSEQVT